MPPPGRFFDSELIARLSRMELTARRIVDGFLAGKNRSSRHGFSVEFVEHREYAPGDDLRHLDWKVLGRLDRFYIKRYEEETNITAVFVLDASASMTYASEGVSKFETAATAASALAYLLHRQRDAVGLALHDEAIRAYLEPSVKSVSLASLLSTIQDARPGGRGALEPILTKLAGDLTRRCLFIVLSDLLGPLEEFRSAMKFLQYHGHDAMVLQILDQAERTFPFKNNVLFRGLEDRRELVTEPQRLRSRYLELLEEFLDAVRKTCQGCAFDYQLLETGSPLAPALTGLLAARKRRQQVVRHGRSL